MYCTKKSIFKYLPNTACGEVVCVGIGCVFNKYEQYVKIPDFLNQGHFVVFIAQP